jgi:dTDP-4-dehydrorhamnose reductase
MITKLILLGKTGMLGGYIYKYFSDLRVPIQVVSEFRVTAETLGEVEQILIDKGLDEETCVINCIGKIPQRHGASESDKDYFLVNSVFPHILWTICKRYGAKMIQPATDCVYTGLKGGYIETDVHDERGSYGMSKSLGEPLGCTVIRSSIIGRELLNKASLIEFVFKNQGKTIQGWKNHMWNGITCLEYCKVIQQIIVKDMFWSGVRHIVSPRAVSKYELLQIVKEAYGLTVVIQESDGPTKVDKTLNTIYVENGSFNIPDLVFQLKELSLFHL